jgi:phosphohistidine phosphatase
MSSPSNAQPAFRTLILLRHGKSAYPPGVGDHERPLANRGQQEAKLAGDWIRQHCPSIDAICCSSATRTRQTLEATGLDGPTTFLGEIYSAYPEEVLEVVNALDPAVRTALIVGHAPGIPGLADDLAGPESDPPALGRLEIKFPTSAVAVLTFTGEWATLRENGAVLVDFVVPRA